MKLKIKQITVILLAHYLFHPFYFEGISITVQQLIIFGSIMIYAILNLNNITPLFKALNNHKKIALLSLIGVIFVVSASFITPIMLGTYDHSYFNTILRTFLYTFCFIILIGMVRKYFYKDEVKYKVLELFSTVHRNYVLVTFVFLLFPSLKFFWLDNLNMTARRIELVQQPQYISRVSWDGYAGFDSTVYATIAVIITIYLIIVFYNKYSYISKKYLLSLFIILIGNSFYGRSGLLVSLLMVGIGIMYLVIIHKQYKLFYSIVGIGIVSFVLITILSQYNEDIAAWYNWAMEPIISLLETGEIQTSSTDTLWSMWFVPELKTLLIGDGYYTSPLTSGYYMNTDVGYLRPVLFYGFFYTILSLLVPTMLGFEMGKDNKENKLLMLMLLVAMFIFEIKGEVVLNFSSIIIMIFMSNYTKKPKKINYETEYSGRMMGVSLNEYTMD